MKSFRLHSQYTSANRYLGRNSGYKRTSGNFSNRYKLSSGKYRSLYEETKNQLSDLDETGTDTPDTTSNKVERTKLTDFTTTGSKYNNGMTKLSSGIDDMAELLGKDTLDTDKAYDAASDFVKGYNSVYASVKNTSNSTIANKASAFASTVRTFSRALDKVGVSVNAKDGTLSIDKEKFSKASVKDITNVFGPKSSFATLIEEEADSVSKVAAATSYKSANLYDNTFGAKTIPTSAFSGAFFNKKY